MQRLPLDFRLFIRNLLGGEGTTMLYKGGPKNYSKGDWMVIKAIVGIVVVASIVAKIADPGSSGPESAYTSVADSSEFVDAAKRAGYSASDGDQVAAAAAGDRKSDGKGTGGKGRVDHGGERIRKKQ